ncbi:MAG: hypothetical protein R3D71_05990 [Rickettsiales bacterium]
MKLGELFFELKTKDTSFSAQIKQAEKNTLLFAAKVSGAYYSLDRLVGGTLRTGTGLVNLATEAGVSASAINAVGIAAAKLNAGLSLGDANNQLAGFLANLQQIRTTGQGNTEFLGKISELSGVGTGALNLLDGSVLDAFMRIADVTEKMDRQKVSQIVRSMGLGIGWVDFMMKPRAERENLLAESGTISDKQIKAADEANRAIKNTSIALEVLTNKILAELAPAISDAAKWITEKINEVDASKIEIFFNGWIDGIKGVGKTVADSADLALTSGMLGISKLQDLMSGKDRQETAQLYKHAGKLIGDIGNTVGLFPNMKESVEDFVAQHGGKGGTKPVILLPMTEEQDRAMKMTDIFGDNANIPLPSPDKTLNMNNDIKVTVHSSNIDDGKKVGENIGKGISGQIMKAADRQNIGQY